MDDRPGASTQTTRTPGHGPDHGAHFDREGLEHSPTMAGVHVDAALLQ